MILEGLECIYNPESNITFGSCDITTTGKLSGHAFLQLNVSEPIHTVYLHAVLYRMSVTGVYRKFAIDLWENVCGWLDGTVKSSLLDGSLGKAFNYSDTNLNHKCPFEGYMYMKTENLSLSKFPFANINMDIVPSGSYRINAIVTDKVDGQWYVEGKVYFSVSGRPIMLWSAKQFRIFFELFAFSEHQFVYRAVNTWSLLTLLITLYTNPYWFQ